MKNNLLSFFLMYFSHIMSYDDRTTDFVDYVQLDYKIIDFKIWKEYFENKNYFSLIKMLYKKPMTISQLHQKIVQEDEEQKIRSENTIYRHIQDLITAEIVSVAGHQLSSSQVSSKLIYALSAKIILFDNINLHYLRNKHGIILAEMIGNIIKEYYGKSDFNAEKLLRIIVEIESSQSQFRNKITELITTHSTISQELKELNAEEIYKFYSTIGVLFWLIEIDMEKLLGSLSSVFSVKQVNKMDIKHKTDQLNEQQESRKYHDHLTYSPTSIYLVNEQKSQRLKNRFEFAVLLKILRGNPKSIKEIHSNFYDQWKRSYDSFAKIKEKLVKKGRLLIKEYPKPTTRSENTIYQYIKELIDLDIVVECGRRMFSGQSTTQILYCRKSKVFFYQAFDESFWNFMNSRKLSDLFHQCLKIYYEGKIHLGIETLLSHILSFSQQTQENLRGLLKDLPRDISFDPLSTFTLYETRVFNSLLGLLIGIHVPENQDTIKLLKSDL
ncbi:MAG: hypothetical protein ACXAD7_17740 [Candidatus Kariarchaeaceae archaeon]|jgi:hypothetical protein